MKEGKSFSERGGMRTTNWEEIYRNLGGESYSTGTCRKKFSSKGEEKAKGRASLQGNVEAGRKRGGGINGSQEMDWPETKSQEKRD